MADCRWFAGRSAAAAVAVVLCACTGERPAAPTGAADRSPAATDSAAAGRAAAPAGPAFTDVAAAAGLTFRHVNGMSGQRYFVEVVGPGAALFDADNDGDLDLYAVQGHALGPEATPDAAGRPTGRLFRNDVAANGALRFTDVTDASGLRADGYGMGAAAGDVDGDGWVDLYLTNWGPNALWRNKGDGTFEDVTARAGVADSGWSTSASLADIDRDGDLDLFVAHYERWDYATDRPCHSPDSGRPDYCGPKVYPPEPDRVFRNRGDGTFEDATLSLGVIDETGPGLGVVAFDANRDGWLDWFVANDGRDNQLWQSEAGGRFVDRAAMSGSAVNRDGDPEAGMGVVAADVDNDGDEELFITHLRDEKNTLYQNLGGGLFADKSYDAGLAAASLPYTGFGTCALDVDNDGWQDLLVANGAVTNVEAQAVAGDPLPLKEPNQLFRNLGEGRFEDAASLAGPDVAVADVSRGMACGDIDNDGDTDAVVMNNNGPAQLLRNDIGQANAWLGARLVDAGGRDAFGALAALDLAGASAPVLRVHTDGSYLSAGDPRVLFGLGASTAAPATVRVTWPDGRREAFGGLATRRYHTLRQGDGTSTP